MRDISINILIGANPEFCSFLLLIISLFEFCDWFDGGIFKRKIRKINFGKFIFEFIFFFNFKNII